jgi:hypothetical protein
MFIVEVLAAGPGAIKPRNDAMGGSTRSSTRGCGGEENQELPKLLPDLIYTSLLPTWASRRRARSGRGCRRRRRLRRRSSHGEEFRER